MDVRVLTSIQGGPQSPVAALAPEVPSNAQQVLTELATSGGLSESELTALSIATARVAQSVASPELQQVALAQISSTGLFLRSTDTQGLPRWNVMTALRSYGLNRPDPKPNPATDAQVVQQVRQQLENVVRESRGVSLNQAIAAVRPTPVQQHVASSEHTVDTVESGVDAGDVPTTVKVV